MYETRFRTLSIDDVKIFYREAGDWRRPSIVLLHGLPTSSHMFRDLIGRLSDRFHVLAPDYPGFGSSDCPEPERFSYTFENLSMVIERFLETLGVDRLSLYMHGAGVPVGLRICVRHPRCIEALIIQNGNVTRTASRTPPSRGSSFGRIATRRRRRRSSGSRHREGIVWQYVDGVRDKERISPDAWNMDCANLSRPLNGRIQMELLYDYRRNLEEYPRWHAYFRDHQPPALISGAGTTRFSPSRRDGLQRDLRDVEFHLLDSGHFALEDCGYEIGQHVISFLERTAVPEPRNAVESSLGVRSIA